MRTSAWSTHNTSIEERNSKAFSWVLSASLIRVTRPSGDATMMSLL